MGGFHRQGELASDTIWRSGHLKSANCDTSSQQHLLRGYLLEAAGVLLLEMTPRSSVLARAAEDWNNRKKDGREAGRKG